MSKIAGFETQKTCSVCGQEIDLLIDSWQGGLGPDSKIRHTVCPTSPELKAVPVLPASDKETQSVAAAPTPKYLTVEEVADMLRITPQTVRRLVREGKLSAKRLALGASKLLIDQADALALLEDA